MSARAPDPTPLELGQAAAARLGAATWQVDVDEDIQESGVGGQEAGDRKQESEDRGQRTEDRRHGTEDRGQKTEAKPAQLFPSSVAPAAAEPPPSPLLIVEAMLFVGGPPLTPEKVCSAIRGMTPVQVRELIDELGRKYRRQNRPYAVQPRGDGYVIAVKPQYRAVREKLFGGPKEARLTQPALDVLSLIAYRQPLTKAEVDSLRGADSAGVVRQLVRLGLIAVTARGDAESPGVRYGTTARFLDLFGLGSLDDLPRLEG